MTFHRVIPGFVSQGGDPTGTGAGGPGYSIPCETDGNPHRHLVGSLSMAHAGHVTQAVANSLSFMSHSHT